MNHNVINFFSHVMRLKRLPRAGRKRCGVRDCESVAEHTFGVAMLALLVSRTADSTIDRDRCIALALVHDLAEASVGDITPHDGIDREEKQRRERDAMDALSTMLGDGEILALWMEFEAGETAEARL